MTTSTDADCNRVAYWPDHPDLTDRCTMPEGHEGDCWWDVELMRHKHRRPTHTFTDPFDVVPLGGRHRRRVALPVVSGPQRAESELMRRLALATGGVA